jgi:RNA polymerase sigma-70 factor (sigma-E family)
MDFDQYLTTHGDALLRHAVIVTADPHVAQDVTQAVLERAWQRWSTIGQFEHPDAYLRRMIVNEFVSARRRLRRLEFRGQVLDRRLTSDLPGASADRVALIASIRPLPPKQRAALALRYWHGLSYTEIGAELGCSEATARSHVARAFRRLRIDLQEPPPTAATPTPNAAKEQR